MARTATRRTRRAAPEVLEVKVVRIGGEIKTIALEADSTVEEALVAAGIDVDGEQVPEELSIDMLNYVQFKV